MNVFLIEACYYDEMGKMRMKKKTNCAGHSIFFDELPSNYVNVENSNKCLFLKVKGWTLIQGGHLFNNLTLRVGAYSKGRLFEGALARGITVSTSGSRKQEAWQDLDK